MQSKSRRVNTLYTFLISELDTDELSVCSKIQTDFYLFCKSVKLNCSKLAEICNVLYVTTLKLLFVETVLNILLFTLLVWPQIIFETFWNTRNDLIKRHRQFLTRHFFAGQHYANKFRIHFDMFGYIHFYRLCIFHARKSE